MVTLDFGHICLHIQQYALGQESSLQEGRMVTLVERLYKPLVALDYDKKLSSCMPACVGQCAGRGRCAVAGGQSCGSGPLPTSR